MDALLQFAFSGLTVGAIYGLVALGFTLIFNVSGVVNFAQGEFVMLGGMVTVFAAAGGMPLPLAALTAILVAVAAGLLLDVLAIGPARRAAPITLIIITIGAALVIRGLAQVFFDKEFHKLPGFSGDTPIRIGGAAILSQTFWILLGTAALLAGLWWFMTRTLTGKALRATAANRLAAELVGIDTRVVTTVAFVVSAAIGAMAGILVTPVTLTNYDVGTMLALKAFVAAVLGGMGHPVGAVVGGLLLGLFEAFAAGYLSSSYKDAAAIVVLLLVLLTMPNGLFTRRSSERV
ncbi:MAG: branched-chain amino acid ABC transporter permease [Hyphomicrobiaceae bacterium]|nr:MAG: branched-chain amino acid ABC transporter permease [Hyphomicrobiaceae bacterium]